MGRGRTISFLCLTGLANFAVAAAQADVWPACAGTRRNPSLVEATGARDGVTFRLTDGREVRLAGVIAASELDGDPDAAKRAAGALDRLVAGKQVLIYTGANAADRYERIVAQVALAQGEGAWVQGLLVADGMLRGGPEAGEPACSQALIAEERRARAAKAGLWTEPRFSVQAALDLGSLNAAIGRFAVVEGWVTRVAEKSTRTYIDFGRRYSEDFTIIVPREARAEFRAAGIDLKALRGKRVRGRGVLFSAGGPAIEIRKPAAIEILQGSGT